MSDLPKKNFFLDSPSNVFRQQTVADDQELNTSIRTVTQSSKKGTALVMFSVFQGGL
jgi:hypothetical protein